MFFILGVYQHALVELEKNKTLSDAAKNLFVTQSALSRSMRKLENILGVELFARKKIPLL